MRINSQSTCDPNRAGESRLTDRLLRAFTLVEMLVVMGVLGILSSLLLMGISKAKAASKMAQCSNNHRQCALGGVMYLHDNHRFLPIIFDGDRSEINHYVPPTVKVCPNSIGFYYNGWGSGGRFTAESLGLVEAGYPGSKPVFKGLPETTVLAPSDMLMFLDIVDLARPPRMRDDNALIYTNFPHSGAANVSYCDGHVGSLKRTELIKPSEAIKVKYNNDHLAHNDTWQ